MAAETQSEILALSSNLEGPRQYWCLLCQGYGGLSRNR